MEQTNTLLAQIQKVEVSPLCGLAYSKKLRNPSKNHFRKPGLMPSQLAC